MDPGALVSLMERDQQHLFNPSGDALHPWEHQSFLHSHKPMESFHSIGSLQIGMEA